MKEYRSLEVQRKHLDRELNSAAAEGWRLSFIVALVTTGGVPQNLLVVLEKEGA